MLIKMINVLLKNVLDIFKTSFCLNIFEIFDQYLKKYEEQKIYPKRNRN